MAADASVGDAGNACGMGSFVEARFEPPLDGGGRIDQARFQGIEAEASAVNGVRVHLDLCPDPSGPCPQDAVIAGIGADVAAQLSIPDGMDRRRASHPTQLRTVRDRHRRAPLRRLWR